MRLVLLGPPGAGKGTQAAAVRDMFGVPHISTGEMLRAAIAAGTPLGQRAKVIVDSGNLVPDDVMGEIVKERLSAPDALGGFLLDGYPRTLSQATTLDAILQALGEKLDHVVYLFLDDAEIVTRLSGRRTCATCGAPCHVTAAPPRVAGICDICGGALVQREDDHEAIVARRLKVYHQATAPLVDFYRRQGLLREIDARGTVHEVQARLLVALRRKSAPRTPSRMGSEG